MPRGDGTGPNGMGQMTGRAAGFCAGFNMPGFSNPSYGRGYGQGATRGMNRGNGAGRRQRFCATAIPGWQRGGQGWGAGFESSLPMNQTPTLDALKSQSKYLEELLDDVNKSIESMQEKK